MGGKSGNLASFWQRESGVGKGFGRELSNLASFWQRESGVGKGFGRELSKRQRLFSC